MDILKELKLTRPVTDEEVASFMKSASPAVREAAEKLDLIKRQHTGSIALPASGSCPAAWPVRVGSRCFTRSAADNQKQAEENLTKHLVDVNGAIMTVDDVKDLVEIGKDLAAEDTQKRGLPISDPEGGVHGHGLIRRENKTLWDGPHVHLLVLEDGTAVISEEDGPHEHVIPRGKRRSQKGGPHVHEFKLPNGQSVFTQEDGEHDHDLLVFTTGFDGTHEHKIKISGKTLTTISPAQFVEAHPEVEEQAPVEVGSATEIMKALQPSDSDDYDGEAELLKHLEPIEKDFQKSWDEADQWVMKVFIQKQTDVQSVVLAKSRFKTVADASQWVKDHDFKTTKVDETTNTFRFRQFDPGLCREGTFRNKRITDGVLAVICVPKSSDLPPGGFGKANKEELIANVKGMLGELSESIGKAMYKWLDLPYNSERNTDSPDVFQVDRVVKAIVVEKTPCESCDEGSFNYLVAVGPVSKKELKTYKQTAVVDGKNYVVIGKTSGTDVKAEPGDIIEVKATKLELDRQNKKHELSWSEGSVVKTSDLKSPDPIAKVVTLATPFEKMYRESLEKKIKIFPDGDQHFILGIMLEPETVDSQKEIYSAEEIEAAAHHYLEVHRNVGYMHKELINDKVKLVESYVTRSDMVIGNQKVKKGTWIVGLLVLDHEIWKQIKSGELTGLSIGGSAIRVPA